MTFMARVPYSAGSVTAPPAMNFSIAKVLATCTATTTFKTDGSITVFGSGGATTITNTTHNWFTPTTPSVGTRYYLKLTATSGTFTGNPAPTFTILSSDLAANVNALAGGTHSVTYTVQIATDAAGTNIVSSQTGNILSADGT